MEDLPHDADANFPDFLGSRGAIKKSDVLENHATGLKLKIGQKNNISNNIGQDSNKIISINKIYNKYGEIKNIGPRSNHKKLLGSRRGDDTKNLKKKIKIKSQDIRTFAQVQEKFQPGKQPDEPLSSPRRVPAPTQGPMGGACAATLSPSRDPATTRGPRRGPMGPTPTPAPASPSLRGSSTPTHKHTGRPKNFSYRTPVKEIKNMKNIKTDSPGPVRKLINKFEKTQTEKRENLIKTQRETIKQKRKQTRIENFLVRRETSEKSEITISSNLKDKEKTSEIPLKEKTFQKTFPLQNDAHQPVWPQKQGLNNIKKSFSLQKKENLYNLKK